MCVLAFSRQNSEGKRRNKEWVYCEGEEWFEIWKKILGDKTLDCDGLGKGVTYVTHECI